MEIKLSFVLYFVKNHKFRHLGFYKMEICHTLKIYHFLQNFDCKILAKVLHGNSLSSFFLLYGPMWVPFIVFLVDIFSAFQYMTIIEMSRVYLIFVAKRGFYCFYLPQGFLKNKSF